MKDFMDLTTNTTKNFNRLPDAEKYYTLGT
jgi:hypothetical protein